MISQPVIYKINRFIFGRKTVNYLKSLLFSSGILLLILIAGNLIVNSAVSGLLERLRP